MADRTAPLPCGWTPDPARVALRRMGDAKATDPMPVFTIKAKDILAVRAVGAYMRLCDELGLTEQAAQVELAMTEIDSWRRRNPELVQIPDHSHVPVTAELDAIEADADVAGADHPKETPR